MQNTKHRSASDRGAILVHVAVALLVITAMSTFAFDFGLFWLSRSEAQNAADGASNGGSDRAGLRLTE